MSSSLALLLAFAAFCGAIAIAAKWAGGRVGAPETAFFFLLAIGYLFPGFFSGRTILPADHAMLLAPWSHVGAGDRYNANLNDAVTQMAPWAKAVRIAWKEGSLPLRDRWNGAGMALAANGQSAPFSPFTILMLPFALWAGFTLQVAAKLFLALSGFSLWLRELGISRAAAVFGSVLFALSFTMAPWLLFPHTAVISLFPWALFAIEVSRRAEPQARFRGEILLACVLAAWPLCGHPESIVICVLFMLLWFGARAAAGDLPDARRLAVRTALAAVAAVTLTAFLTLPEAVAIFASNRVRVAEAFRSALPAALAPHTPYWWTGILTSLFPRALGDAIRSPMIPGGAGPFPEMTLGYFGLVGAAAALLLLRPGSPRKKAELALLLPVALGAAAATGTWPVFEAAIRIPGLRLMFVLRYLSWVALAGPAIAAFEADRLARDAASQPRGRAALGLAGAAAALALVAIWCYRKFEPLHAAAGGLPSQKRALALALSALAAALCVAVGVWARPRIAPWLPAILALAAAAELTWQGTRLYRFQPPARLYPDTPMLDFLRSKAGPFRIVGEGAVLYPNSNVFPALEDVRTHDPVERRDYVDFLDRSAGYPPLDYFKHIGNFNAPALDLLNVRYLAGEPGWKPPGEKWKPVYDGKDGVVFENPLALPRVFDARRIPPEGRMLAGSVVVSGYRESTNSASFHARLAEPSRLVVSLVQDGGWSAKDGSGRRIPLARAEGLLLALDLPAGDSDVRLSYLPPGMAAGASISAAAAVLILVAALLRFRARKRSYPRGSPARLPG
ncbi:MAG TPA: hypothetical protein VE007_13520 [Thermoanaerobaculia bacterium]|nr:hypothetical protein [Thermoanaerobaculia bacterium]